MPGKNRRQVYLDHAATTPVDERVIEAMLPYFGEVYGNTSSVHRFGRRAEQAVEDARETMAMLLGCHASEVVFTSGGSEGANLAIRGAAWHAKLEGRGTHLLTTPVEHSAVGRTVDQLSASMDFASTLLPVNLTGQVEQDTFADAIRDRTVVASVIYGNNEVGTVNPIVALTEQARQHGVVFHTDAVQAAGQLPLDVSQLGVDLLSISAHKFYGPKGVGALYVREGLALVPSHTGGSHEQGRRPGTLNTPGIVGMAAALKLAYEEFDERVQHYRALRDQLINGVTTRIPGASLTGHPTDRLPNHASFVFDGVDSNMLVIHLDMKGVAASSASACKTGNPTPSGVLLAMGYPAEQALGSLRLTVGRKTTEDDVEFAIDALVDTVENVRKLKREMTL